MHESWIINRNPFSDEPEEESLNQEPEICPNCGEDMKECLCGKEY